MPVSSFCVRGYKSIRDSGEVLLVPGVTIVVGRNNAGKTALLEAIALRSTPGANHRTITTHPHSQAADASEIRLSFRFVLPRNHLRDVLSKAPDAFQLRRLPNHTDAQSAEEMSRRLREDLAVQVTSRVIGNSAQALLCEIEGLPTSGSTFTANFDPRSLTVGVQSSASQGPIFSQWLEPVVRGAVYLFKAERLNVGVGPFGTNDKLQPDAGNLAEVLHTLQTGNPYRFRRLVDQCRAVFPDIYDVTVTPIQNNQQVITVWDVDPKTERKDLTRPLAQCGTGLGQVLAILYVTIHTDQPQTILIDEPQSFLHPGAARKLMEILRGYPQHQFVIATHLPSVISAAQPDLILRLEKRDHETHITRIEKPQISDMQGLLADLGVRLSDVFGMDRILWVEGQTEEACFPIILSDAESTQSETVAILGVINTGDFAANKKKDRERIIRLYKRLSGAPALLPPAIAFLFDREQLSDSDREDLQRESGGMIHFLPRRMFENYLLHAPAIAMVLTRLSGTAVAKDQVAQILADHGCTEGSEHLTDADGSRILKEIFGALGNNIEYDKVQYGRELTEVIMKTAPGYFQELRETLTQLVT